MFLQFYIRANYFLEGIMDTECRQYLRLSPYLSQNLQKYQPSAMIPVQTQGNPRNHLQIPNQNSEITSLLHYSKYKPEAMSALLEEECYFCKSISTTQLVHSRCGDCRKIICNNCCFSCGKCGKHLCQFDRAYDYSNETDCCFDC